MFQQVYKVLDHIIRDDERFVSDVFFHESYRKYLPRMIERFSNLYFQARPICFLYTTQQGTV